MNWERIKHDHKDGLKNIKSMVIVDTKVVATHDSTHFASSLCGGCFVFITKSDVCTHQMEECEA